MYRILEPTAQILAVPAIPAAFLAAVVILRFPFGAW
jgi:hypothetical protein